MGQFQESMAGPSIPTFGLSDTDYSSLKAPNDNGLFRLVIPTNGLDTEFIWKVSQLMEISFERQDPIEMANLTFVIQESFRQMFTNFDRSPAVFIPLLEGSLTNPAAVGLPTLMYFNHIEAISSPNKWSQFVTIFRHYALELYDVVLGWANHPSYSGLGFKYNDFPLSGGSLGFIIFKERNNYVI